MGGAVADRVVGRAFDVNDAETEFFKAGATAAIAYRDAAYYAAVCRAGD